jgi:hypothetical protein
MPEAPRSKPIQVLLQFDITIWMLTGTILFSTSPELLGVYLDRRV